MPPGEEKTIAPLPAVEEQVSRRRWSLLYITKSNFAYDGIPLRSSHARACSPQQRISGRASVVALPQTTVARLTDAVRRARQPLAPALADAVGEVPPSFDVTRAAIASDAARDFADVASAAPADAQPRRYGTALKGAPR